MTITVNLSDMFQTGAGTNKSSLSITLSLTAEAVTFQFSQAAQIGLTFGNPLSLFINNVDNDYEVEVYVTQTQQRFTAPANSSGYYPLDGVPSPEVTLTSAGVASGPVAIAFYNYDRTPFVWYAYGANVSIASVPNGADVALGNTTDAAVTNPALAGTLISITKGVLTGINSAVTALGNIFGDTTSIDTNTAAVATNTDPYNYDNITTSTTTVVKNAPGVFGGVVINTAGGAGTIVIEDGAGNVVATYDSTIVGSFLFGQGVTMATNIRVVTTGAPDVTVIYR